ncbi:MAG: FecR domain-containing protein [Deltaproteobacteria bacterium]|nr:FecR domain-containing protein [Deltaproteobacteria bacterium]
MKIAALIAAFLVFISHTAHAAGSDVGRIVALKGKVTITRGASIKEAALEDVVFVKDTISTQSGTKLKILLHDDTLFTISENSTFVIKEYMLTTKANKVKSFFGLLSGGVRALVGRSNFAIQTPTAVAGVKGTYFNVWLDTEGGVLVTNVAVHTGEVEVSNINDKVKGTVLAGKGQMTTVHKNKPPSQPVAIAPELENKLLDCSP